MDDALVSGTQLQVKLNEPTDETSAKGFVRGVGYNNEQREFSFD